jgi:serine/threonine-protein kinase
LKIRPVGSGDRRDELLREARILFGLGPHAGLPVVREDFFDGDEYIVAMDWVDGTDLARLLAERGAPGLPPSSVMAYLAQAADALTHLHTHDPPVIHGDIKPANLVLAHTGRVVLVDFGVSSSPSSTARRSGTPGYLAPEIASGEMPTSPSVSPTSRTLRRCGINIRTTWRGRSSATTRSSPRSSRAKADG